MDQVLAAPKMQPEHMEGPPTVAELFAPGLTGSTSPGAACRGVSSGAPDGVVDMRVVILIRNKALSSSKGTDYEYD